MSGLFTARYDGSCSHCGEPIEIGDDIAYVADEIACEGCWEDSDEADWGDD
jgi:formylmethanofuran dehydrogenase subunit E